MKAQQQQTISQQERATFQSLHWCSRTYLLPLSLKIGYNSDARQNNNAAIEMDGPQELDKPELGEVLDPSSPSDNQAEESETNNNQQNLF